MSKRAIVTGGSSGIGLEFAKLLARDGYDLLLAARDTDTLKDASQQLADDYGVQVDHLSIDLSKPESADSLWQETKNQPVDILINNAGFGDYASVINADWHTLEAMINLNIKTLTRLSQRAAASMVNHGNGHIVNVASIAAFFPGAQMATYYASKAYVLSFSEALSVELKGTGVYVTALCPGPTATHFQKTAHAENLSIFKGKLPSAEKVARFGYTAMKQRKVVAIPGLSNKLQAHAVLPRSWKRHLVDRVQNR